MKKRIFQVIGWLSFILGFAFAELANPLNYKNPENLPENMIHFNFLVAVLLWCVSVYYLYSSFNLNNSNETKKRG